MLIAVSNTSRRGALTFIALLSCLNILCGFVMITKGKAEKSHVPSPIETTPPENLILSLLKK